MVDKKFIGYRSPPFEVEVEKGRLRLFAKALGEQNPIYYDETAAEAARDAYIFLLSGNGTDRPLCLV